MQQGDESIDFFIFLDLMPMVDTQKNPLELLDRHT
jgi:hypothetical protein